jgi:hypothetical protein
MGWKVGQAARRGGAAGGGEAEGFWGGPWCEKGCMGEKGQGVMQGTRLRGRTGRCEGRGGGVGAVCGAAQRQGGAKTCTQWKEGYRVLSHRLGGGAERDWLAHSSSTN